MRQERWFRARYLCALEPASERESMHVAAIGDDRRHTVPGKLIFG